jgi:DNA polymerase III subunit delta
MDAIAFLGRDSKPRRQPIYVLTGEEDFLKRRVRERLMPVLLGESDPSFALSSYSGDSVDFSTIRNELGTLPFLCERRIVLIDQADGFVSKYRPVIEKYVAAPSQVGILLLDVKTWTSTTKLAKAIPDAATIQCKAPAQGKLASWCTEWAKEGYDKKLATPAANLLVELVGAHLGVLDQEIAKLSDYAGDKAEITTQSVDEMVGRSREAQIFKIMDSIGDNKPDQALEILREVFEQGDDPFRVLGALSSQIRKLAQVARLYDRTKDIETALSEGGIPAWPQARDNARKQLKHLGATRLNELYTWLLETDLGMKGDCPLPNRLQVERLLVRLAKPK